MKQLGIFVSATRFPIGIGLAAVFVSLVVIYWWLTFAFSDSENEATNTFWVVLSILIVYLIFLSKYFVENEGNRYTFSSFAISVILSAAAYGYYESQVGSWFWNSDWVLEDALLSSIRPPIILLIVNELFGVILNLNRTTEYGTSEVREIQPTSMRRIGLLASLPLCSTGPFGLFLLISTLVFMLLFSLSYLVNINPT